MNNNLELLAPAGDEKSFYAAVNYGANAVYLGLEQFSARRNAGNFSFERLPFVIAYAHYFGVKVYVAVNTVVKNDEFEEYVRTIGKAQEAGVDAFIVQDVFFGRLLKRAIPNIVLHLSTQAGVNNVDGAKLALSYGFSRVILARETAEREIAAICKIIETEVFVQGALCSSLSGHCYFSSFIGGKSGNRGACRQPCRKLYKYEGKGVKQNLRYALSLSDLNLSKKIERLTALGVKSFKIEGRMRGFEYVSAACDYYRGIIDGAPCGDKAGNLARCYNRGGYTEGLGFGQDKKLLSPLVQNHLGVEVGKISSVNGDYVSVRFNKYAPKEGDCFKILRDGKERGNATVKICGGKAVIGYRGNAAVSDSVNLTKDCSLTLKYSEFKRKNVLPVIFTAKSGEPLSIELCGKKYFSEFVASKAVNCPSTKKEIKENLRKTDVYPFDVEPKVDMESDLFIQKKAINELRARAYKEYFFSFQNAKNVNTEKIEEVINDFKSFYDCGFTEKRDSVTVISHDFGFLKKRQKTADDLVFCPNDYSDLAEFDRFFAQTKGLSARTYLYVPAFLSEADERIVSACAEKFYGLYVESASGIYLAKRLKKAVYSGIELNVTNSADLFALKGEGVENIALSKELCYNELEKLSGSALLLGDVKVMTLIYCPFGKECGECTRGFRLSLKDEEGRTFKVRRYKLSACRFEIYNADRLFSKKRLNNQIFDFTVCEEAEAIALLDKYCSEVANAGGKNAKTNTKRIECGGLTSGNLIRGIE